MRLRSSKARINTRRSNPVVGAIAAAATLVASMTAHAGSSPVTTVESVLVDDLRVGVMIAFSDATTSRPACATRTRQMFLPANGALAKMHLATLLTAVNAGKKVRLLGTGTCHPSGAENMRAVIIYK